MDAQVLSSLEALDLHLVASLALHLPLRQVALAALHHNLIVSEVHADRVETLEIAILSVLDNHRVVHLELVRILEMLTTLVLVLSSSSSALSIAEHLELTEVASSAGVDALLRPKRQVLSGLRRLEFHDAAALLVHLEHAEITSVAGAVHFAIVRDAQVLALLRALEHHLVASLGLSHPLGEISLSAIGLDTVPVALFHSNMGSTVEVSTLAVLDDHFVVLLELVLMLERHDVN